MSTSEASPADVLDSAVAIAMNMGSDGRHEEAYSKALAHEDGQVGFHEVAKSGAIALEQFAMRHKIEWGTNADWLVTCDALSDELIRFMIQRGRKPEFIEIEAMVVLSVDWDGKEEA